MKKTSQKTVFQGDVCFRRVDQIPESFARENGSGPVVVAHSETGHHHVIEDNGVVRFANQDPLICYLQLESTDHCDVVHKRPFDTHETIRLEGRGSTWQVIRQREWTPQGWRRVED